MLLDARLDEPVGTLFGKAVYLHRAREIAVENHEGRPPLPLVVALAHVGEGLSEGGTVVRLVRRSVAKGLSRIEHRRRKRRAFSVRWRSGPAPAGLREEFRIRSQFFHGADIELSRRSLAVIVGAILHKAHAMPHFCPTEQHRGQIGRRRVPKRCVELPHIVTVALENAPSIGLPERPERRGHDLPRSSGNLDVVAIDQGREIFQFLLGGHASRLRDLSLHLLSVTHEDEDTAAPAPYLLRQSVSDACGESLAEISAPPVDAGDIPLHMSLERAAAGPEMGQDIPGLHKSPGSKSRIGPRRGVTVAYHHEIPVDFSPVFGRHIRNTIHEKIHLQAGKRARGMSAVGKSGHGDDPGTAPFCRRLDPGYRRLVRLRHGEISQVHIVQYHRFIAPPPQSFQNALHPP